MEPHLELELELELELGLELELEKDLTQGDRGGRHVAGPGVHAVVRRR